MSEQMMCDWCGAPIWVREAYAAYDSGNYHLDECAKEAAEDAAMSAQEDIGVDNAREEGTL
jgi:hypothetical protein